MSRLQQALELVRKRLRDKRSRAEDAYVNSKRTKTTKNCTHCGPNLGDQYWGCKLMAIGENSIEAARCYDQKASYCPLFALPKPLQEFRQDFQNLAEEELRIRWPAIGELVRVEQLLHSLVEEEKNE